MYLVFKSQLSQVALGTTQDIPGTPHYFTLTCQSQMPSCHGTTQDIPGTSHYLTPSCQSQVRVVPSCHGTTQDIPGTPHQPASPRSKLPWDNSGHPRNLKLPYTILLSQVAMGQPRTSQELPTNLLVPGPSCHGTTQDIPGTLNYHTPSCCPKLPWDNPGHPRNSPPTC